MSQHFKPESQQQMNKALFLLIAGGRLQESTQACPLSELKNPVLPIPFMMYGKDLNLRYLSR